MDVREPEIKREEILFLQDDHFCPGNVCIVSGSGTGIGRAVAVAAAANNLMTVGLDINEEEGKKTEKMAREMGGQMTFIKTDLCRDEEVEQAIAEAANLFIFGFSRFARYLIGGDLLFDGGIVLTYKA